MRREEGDWGRQASPGLNKEGSERGDADTTREGVDASAASPPRVSLSTPASFRPPLLLSSSPSSPLAPAGRNVLFRSATRLRDK